MKIKCTDQVIPVLPISALDRNPYETKQNQWKQVLDARARVPQKSYQCIGQKDLQNTVIWMSTQVLNKWFQYLNNEWYGNDSLKLGKVCNDYAEIP